MKRKIITTADGSKTIHIEDWNEQYHSIHGALQEAEHVFIKHGLHHTLNLQKGNDKSPKQLSLLEIGFGTGLNAYLTFLEAEKNQVTVHYEGIEAYPVSIEEIEQLNYSNLKHNPSEAIFKQLHLTPWETKLNLTPFFELKKRQQFFKDITDIEAFNLIYFDAFGARVQPELWTEAVFCIMFKALKPQGTLVTYAAKGSVRRAMQAVGFKVERLPGPPGKREMLRATKPLDGIGF